jgi:hypothetical protein
MVSSYETDLPSASDAVKSRPTERIKYERTSYTRRLTPSASPAPNCVYFGWNEVELPRCGFYGNVEMDCVHNAAALELHPDAICAHTRESEIELNLRRAIGDERMRMHHIDQIVAYGEHVAPRLPDTFPARRPA